MTLRTMSKIASSLVIALLITLGVYLLASYRYVGDRIVYIVGDTCGYELASAVSSYPGLGGVIVYYQEMNFVRPRITEDTVVVLLHTNVSSEYQLEYLLVTLNESISASRVVATDLVLSRIHSDLVVSNDDIWLYCMEGDQEVLARVANKIREVVVKSVSREREIPLASLSLLVSAMVVGVVIYVDELSNILRETTRRLLSILSLITVVLGLRIDRTKILEHPLRQEIYRYLLENGDSSFSELMDKLKCSRATLEWHLSLLIRAGIIQEYRKNRVRYYKLVNKIHGP